MSVAQSVPFTLDPQLARDTVPVMDLALSTVRLMDEAQYPWLLLVPRRPGIAELIDLDASERALLIEEIATVSTALQAITACHKLNVATLGNAVRQLHVHVIARFPTDPAWPSPVFGKPVRPYEAAERAAMVAKLAARLAS